MKKQRLNFKFLAIMLFALFLLLGLYGGYSVTTYGNRWFSTNRNPRVRAQKKTVLAGDIMDRNHVLLAHTNEDGERVYQADEASRMAVVHVIGDQQNNVSNAVESFQTNYLYGFQSSFSDLLGSLISGKQRRGDTVTLTIDSRLCTAIANSFASNPNSACKRGAAVVMNYKTGEVLGEVSLPGYDPMNLTDEVKASAASPFWNRATQAVYPPGSTFKTVTTASALENITGIEDIDFDCLTGDLDFGEHTISDYQSEHHGTIKLRQAFIESCNKMYATIALNLGNAKLLQTAQAFGFNDNFLFRDLVVENSSFPAVADSDYALAASGFGQSAVAATPMHMCMIAAAVANNGVMMEPRLLQGVTGPAGGTRATFQSKVYRTAMTPETAATLQSYMRAVVTSGTGRRAAVNGMTICGKTGTADSNLGGEPVTYGWFIGYCADAETPYALAVLVEHIDPNTSGGTTAAPIARDIFEYLKAK